MALKATDLEPGLSGMSAIAKRLADSKEWGTDVSLEPLCGWRLVSSILPSI